MISKVYFQIYFSNNKYYWRLKKYVGTVRSEHDEIIATGHQGYEFKQEAKNDILDIKNHALNATIYDN